MSMYTASVPQLAKILGHMRSWLDRAEAFANQKKFPADTLLEARLAPDMYPLVQQFRSACDTAKFIAARLGDKAPPKDPDTEATFSEIRARIDKTLAFLATVTAEDFEGASKRLVRVNYLPENRRIAGPVYLNESALPNFYFHAVVAYSILRHNGVDLGKTDFIGSFPTVEVALDG